MTILNIEIYKNIANMETIIKLYVFSWNIATWGMTDGINQVIYRKK